MVTVDSEDVMRGNVRQTKRTCYFKRLLATDKRGLIADGSVLVNVTK